MSLVNVEVEQGVALLTLNNPKQRNTITLQMNDELIRLLSDLESRDDVGAIVVTGTPPAFCAGADLNDLKNSSGRDSLGAIYAGFLAVAHCPLPTIAAVNGPAVGAGMNFSLACDVILAGRSARFETRFLHIGIHPGGGHTWRLRRITSHQATLAMVLFGETLNGEEAERIGLAWRCIDDDQLLDHALAMARRVAGYPRDLVRRTKATIMELHNVGSSTAAVEHELDPQAWSMTQPAFVELISRMQQQISSKETK